MGDLLSLPSIVENNELKVPVLIIVGEVVSHYNKLKWFESTESNQKRRSLIAFFMYAVFVVCVIHI